MALIDLTIPLTDGIPGPPGEPGGYVIPFADYDGQGFLAHRLMLYTHLGTHVDAPNHFLRGGLGVEAWPLTQLCGPAMVVRRRRVTHSGELGADDFEWPREPRAGDRIVLATGWGDQWGSKNYFTEAPSLGRTLCEALSAAHIVVLALDLPTPNEADATHVHEVLLGSGVALVEGLINCGRISGAFGTLVCLPLPLLGMDGAPCRTVFCSEE